MTSCKKHLLVLIVLAAMFLSTSAMAADSPKTEAMKRIEMLRIWRLTDLLELSAQDGPRIFPIIQEYDQKIHNHSVEKDKLLAQVYAELAKTEPDDKMLSGSVEKILKHDNSIREIRIEMYHKLKVVLTPEQLAKYMIFEISFQQEMKDIVDQVRRDKRGLHRFPRINKTTPKPPDSSTEE